MKSRLSIFILGLGVLSAFNAQAANTVGVLIQGKHAKHLYNSLTGPKVKQEGAAGHLYRKGISVLCRYTDVDITKHGKAVPPHDPSRYACTVNFNKNGLASPGKNP